jgi:hypothetical protein
LNVQSVREEIIPQPRIRGIIRKELNTKNTVLSVENTPSIRRLDNWGRPVALTDRAPDSKSGGWGFKSSQACHIFEITLF